MGRDTGLPTSSSLFSRSTISRSQQAGLGEHLDGGKRHGDPGLHVQRARTPQASLGDTARHGFERAHGPTVSRCPRSRTGLPLLRRGPKREFEDVAEGALAMHLYPAAQCARMVERQRPACIHGGLVV